MARDTGGAAAYPEPMIDTPNTTCSCAEPDSTGPLNGGVEVCLTCGWPIEERQ